MEESKKLVQRIYWKKGHSKFFDESSAIWNERVVVRYNDNTKEPEDIEYLFFRVDPILKKGGKCADKYEIEEAIKREGWSVGMGRLTYKEHIPLSQLPECIAFKEAYQETYEAIIEEAARDLPESEKHTAIYKDLDYTLSEFLEMVKKKFEELKKKMPKIEQKESDLLQLDRFLRAQGFELYEEV